MAYGDRFVGLSGQENRFGADMTVCMAVSFGLFFTMRSLVAKGILVACALFALGGVALSLSRAAFLALGCMWVFWLYRSGRVGAIRWVIPGLLLAVGVVLWSPASVEHRFQTMVNPELRARDESIQGRFVMGVWAVKAFASNPLIGVGGMRFPTWVHDQPGNQGLAWHTIHNAYLSIAAEQGLFGLIPFLMVLALTWLDYSKCWRVIHARRLMRDPQLQEFASWVLFLQLGLLGRIVSAFFHQTHQSKTLWTILAVSPVVVGLVRARIAQLAGTFPQEEPATFLSPAPAPPLPGGSVPAR
jgi:O-antigen ligase